MTGLAGPGKGFWTVRLCTWQVLLEVGLEGPERPLRHGGGKAWEGLELKLLGVLKNVEMRSQRRAWEPPATPKT